MKSYSVIWLIHILFLFHTGLHTGPVMVGICSDYVDIWGVSVDICKAISCSKQNVHLKVFFSYIYKITLSVFLYYVITVFKFNQFDFCMN